MRCPHCRQYIDDADLPEDEDGVPSARADTSRERELREYDRHLHGYRLTKEEAVRRALGHRLDLEATPIPRIRVGGRTIAAIAADEPEFELWDEAFQYIVDLGPAAYGVCLQ